ncbi:MAG: cytochrome c biogenesis protein CcsA [Betaproteobacteria bacterium]
MILLYIVVAALYAIAAWLRNPGAISRGRFRSSAVLIGLALVLHAWTIEQSILTPEGLDLSFLHALSLVAWVTVLVGGISGVLGRLPAVGNVILAVAAVCALAPMAGGNAHRFPYASQPWATAHIAVALVAYALFVVAALHAIVLTGLERKLRRGIGTVDGGDTPPLLTLERFLFRLVAAGFVLLTLTMASGALFSEQLFGKAMTFNHKNVFSLLGWCTFAILLLGRWRYGWRGRRALYWIIAGTTLLVLGYLGSKFVTEIILGR